MPKKKKKSETTDADFADAVFKATRQECEKYSYNCFLRFGEIHIRTRFEAWFFLPTKGKTTLMHSSCPGAANEQWHRQFTGFVTPEEIVTYVHEHEAAKYTTQFVNFSTNF